MKGNPIKHTSCVIRNEKAKELYDAAVNAGVIVDSHISDRDMVRSQKRALYLNLPALRQKKPIMQNGRKVKLGGQ